MPSNDKSRKRRICGLAAVSVTTLGTLLGAPAASATPAEEPPGHAIAELRSESPGTPVSYFFKQGWPVKWEGEGSTVYQWWQKVE